MLTAITVRDIMSALNSLLKGSTMSKTNLYQIYDLKAEAAAGPILGAQRDGPAIRIFYQVLADAKTLPGQYPEDFELRKLGTQDEQTLFIDSILPAQTVATGRLWLEQQQLNRPYAETLKGHMDQLIPANERSRLETA